MTSERFTLRAAVYLILLNDDKVLLSRRFNTGWMDGKYSLIAGHLDGNEAVFDTMVREALEEAGIKINRNDLIPIRVLHRKSDNQEYVDFFFMTERWEGEPSIQEPNKCDDMSWFPINNLPENVLTYVKETVETCRDNVSFVESGWNQTG